MILSYRHLKKRVVLRQKSDLLRSVDISSFAPLGNDIPGNYPNSLFVSFSDNTAIIHIERYSYKVCSAMLKHI